jgi:hypothetical protein
MPPVQVPVSVPSIATEIPTQSRRFVGSGFDGRLHIPLTETRSPMVTLPEALPPFWDVATSDSSPVVAVPTRLTTSDDVTGGSPEVYEACSELLTV